MTINTVKSMQKDIQTTYWIAKRWKNTHF